MVRADDPHLDRGVGGHRHRHCLCAIVFRGCSPVLSLHLPHGYMAQNLPVLQVATLLTGGRYRDSNHLGWAAGYIHLESLKFYFSKNFDHTTTDVV